VVTPLTEKELSALSYQSDIEWGDRGHEIERHHDDRAKAYWGILKLGEHRPESGGRLD
jgi:hypothetical protein